MDFALLGHPVGHSMSPQIHAEVYRAHGLSHRYYTIDCPTEDNVRAAVERLRLGQLAGLNVTVPWKRVALRLADAVDESAASTGAANVLVRDADGNISAHNTDVPALAERLREGVRGTGPALVLGNGGAALAAVAACKLAGIAQIGVSARSWLSTSPRARWRDILDFDVEGVTVFAWDVKDDQTRALFASASCVVQATSAGMRGKPGGEQLADWLPWSELPANCFVYDVVYNPAVTPMLLAAQRRGLPHEGGLSMLVGQAALAVRLWLGIEAPRAEMQRVAELALSEQRGADEAREADAER
jgi:shikimate dehydrogenase